MSNTRWFEFENGKHVFEFDFLFRKGNQVYLSKVGYLVHLKLSNLLPTHISPQSIASTNVGLLSPSRSKFSNTVLVDIFLRTMDTNGIESIRN